MNWIPLASSVARAAAYDPTAQTIFIKRWQGEVWAFEQCGPEIWSAFMVEGISKGEYISHVLERRPYRQIRTV
jgi:hypothetical protein